jgi:xanthine dehydrogenase accessory factor
MNQWMSALMTHTGPSILITVASTEGSVPREAGAKMLVTSAQQFDTIGGGHLELYAIEFARNMLALPDADLPGQRRLERFPLGPTLGQCCGGVVYLAFERIDASATDFYADLHQRWLHGQDSWRAVALDPQHRVDLPLVLLMQEQLGDLPFDIDRTQACHLVRDEHGKRWLIDPCLPYRSHLYLFGAGHVGVALVRTLADLPCQITWVDERDELFPAALPDNVRCEVTDLPETLIDAAPAGSSFLVMTHSHTLDQRLAEHILQRPNIGWFGLIGSRTKRIQFERRLRERGIADSRLADMVCPIGISGIHGKEPAMIAVAVAAQLLQVWEKQQAAAITEQNVTHHERSA